LRPGRFDRQIVVDRPDRKGRVKILEVHTRGKPLAKAIDLDAVAGQTPGFTGDDLQNLVNEAALLAARQGSGRSTTSRWRRGHARDRGAGEEDPGDVGEGAPRHGVARDGPGAGGPLPAQHRSPPQDLGDLARAGARLHDLAAIENKCPTTRAELSDTMAMTLGGRAAEEIVFEEVTAGASNDLEKVPQKQMVMRFGMSEKLAPRVFGDDHGQPFLGRRLPTRSD
jgi:cell division protease FtsH